MGGLHLEVLPSFQLLAFIINVQLDKMIQTWKQSELSRQEDYKNQARDRATELKIQNLLSHMLMKPGPQ